MSGYTVGSSHEQGAFIVKILAPAGYAFNAAAALVLLSACGGTTQVGAPSVPLGQFHVKVRPDNVPRLFVSDLGNGVGNGVVQIFAFPNNSLAQTLTGFNAPAGECVDTAGNVYITDSGNSNIQEYSNSYTLIRTLNDPGNMPVACAVKNSPYRVAVVSGNSPSITVYTGTGLIPPSMTYTTTLFSSIAYDSYHSSNARLYFDGIAGGSPALGYMAPGGSFTFVAPLPVLGPGGVQQPPGNGYLAIGDSMTNKVYHIRTNGAMATNNPPTNPNPTVLSNSCSSFGDFYIVHDAPHERSIVNPETCMGEANQYKFPAGGPPGQHFTSPLIKPVGVVLSQ
jgi:hypothetical protein